MFKFIKKLFGKTSKETAAEQAPYKIEPAEQPVTPEVKIDEPSAIKPQRTKDVKGQFLANDPRTEHNEAWVGGKSPAKKSRKPRNRKPAANTAKPAASTANPSAPAKVAKVKSTKPKNSPR
jgi:hypothetical protein